MLDDAFIYICPKWWIQERAQVSQLCHSYNLFRAHIFIQINSSKVKQWSKFMMKWIQSRNREISLNSNFSDIDAIGHHREKTNTLVYDYRNWTTNQSDKERIWRSCWAKEETNWVRRRNCKLTSSRGSWHQSWVW